MRLAKGTQCVLHITRTLHILTICALYTNVMSINDSIDTARLIGVPSQENRELVFIFRVNHIYVYMSTIALTTTFKNPP